LPGQGFARALLMCARDWPVKLTEGRRDPSIDVGVIAVATRQCPHCGKEVFDQMTQCPYCREAMGPVPRARGDYARAATGKAKIRQGLLYVLLAAVVHYFAGGYSALHVPMQIAPLVTNYLSPLLFLGGIGLAIFGFYLKQTA